jgi:protein transport protein SEC23
MGGVDRTKSLAFYFDIITTEQKTSRSSVYLQFQTTYQHVNGQKRLRVTTVQRIMSAADDIKEMAHGFDQETAAILMARYSVFNTMSQEPMDVIRWLDRLLIKLVARFADFKKDDPNSFKLSREFALFPQFMFYLRRSAFLHTFNASPDESEFYKNMILRENVSNSLVMI